MNHLKPIPLTVILIVFLSACGGDRTARILTSATPAVNTTPPADVELQTATPVQTATFTDLHLETAPGYATPDPLLDLPYTEENPLTEPKEILRILDELQARELAWFSRPGWYRFTKFWPSGRDYTRTKYVLTHVINEDRDCLEQFAYFEQNGIILPHSIRLDDGAFGSITHTLDGMFQVNNMLPPAETPPCDLGNGASIGSGTTAGDFILHDETAQFRKDSNSVIEGIQTDFRVWVEELDGRQTLVLVYDITIEDPALRGSVMDPTTGILSPAARGLRFYYIDLETGLQVRFDEEHYLENGKWVNNDDVGQLYGYEHLETMPELVKDSYEDVAAALSVALNEAEKNNP